MKYIYLFLFAVLFVQNLVLSEQIREAKASTADIKRLNETILTEIGGVMPMEENIPVTTDTIDYYSLTLNIPDDTYEGIILELGTNASDKDIWNEYLRFSGI